MGYTTRYKMNFTPDRLDDDIRCWIKQQQKSSQGRKYLFDGLDVENDDFSGVEEARWYTKDRHCDMKKISLIYPAHTFIIEGVGEINVDVWKEKWHSGKVQFCRVPLKYTEWSDKYIPMEEA